MPTFVYNAIDGNGQVSSGTLTADSRIAALDAIAGRGLTPVKIEGGETPADSGPARGPREAPNPAGAILNPRRHALRFLIDWMSWRSQRVTPAQVEAFTRELANLLAAGVPLAKALSIIKREASNPAAKEQWAAIHDDVVGGKPLAEAMARWRESFPPVYVAMVRAGEVGGFLEVVLNQIADFRAREGELVGKVKAALVYPAVLAVLASAVLVFLMTFFIPKFSGIFEEFGAALPLLTRCILAASHAVTSYGPLVLLVVIVAFILARRVVRSDSGRRSIEAWSLRVPGLGVILARFSLVRFSRMLGTLLGAGVPLVTSLRVAQEAIGNQTLSDAVAQAIEEVKRGTALSRSLGSCSALFPASVVEMIAVAEESGRLDKELLRLAQAYEGELDRRLRMLVALAEPALLFVMASLIGTIVVGMLLPIFTLQDLIK